MIEKICRLCLQTIVENYRTIDESSLKTLKLNLNITTESVMCIECANYLQVFSNLKPAYAYVVDDGTTPLADLKNEVNLDPVRFESTSDPTSPTVTRMQCSFCAKTNGTGGLVSLSGSKENELLVNMLKQHIPFMNLKNTEDLLTCGSCLDTLQGVLSFILKCLEVEEKINKFATTKGTDRKGQIELKDVQQFTFAPTVKLEIEAFDVNELLERKCQQIWTTVAPIKDEEMDKPGLTNKTELVDMEMEHADINLPELVIKTDHVDIKSENSDSDSFQEPFVEYKIDDDPLKITTGTSETRPKSIKSASEATTFKREMSPYETEQQLTHNSASDINMFSCGMCSFHTRDKHYLERHMLLIHKRSSAVTKFKCEMCSYESKHKQNFKRHLLIHKGPSETYPHKCKLCSFNTKSQVYLKQHMRIHKPPWELNIFKCELCSFDTKSKVYLNRHLRIHKSSSEASMFKCDKCSYEAKRKHQLKRHFLIHADKYV